MDIYVGHFLAVVLVMLCGIVASLVLTAVFSVILWMDGSWGWSWHQLCHSIGCPIVKLLQRLDR